MKVSTYLFGEIEVNPDTVITFPAGLAGFEQCRRFTLLHEAGENAPSSYTLQSLDEGTIAFQIIEPAALGFNYDLGLSEEEAVLLQTPAAEDVAVMLLIYREGDGEGKSGINANVRAPLLINTRARVGLQKIMEQVRPTVTLSNLASPV